MSGLEARKVKVTPGADGAAADGGPGWMDVTHWAEMEGIDGCPVTFSPGAWTSTSPGGLGIHWLDAMRAREVYIRSVLRGLRRKFAAGRGGQRFEFTADREALKRDEAAGWPGDMPPAAAHEVVFEAMAVGDKSAPQLLVRLLRPLATTTSRTGRGARPRTR